MTGRAHEDRCDEASSPWLRYAPAPVDGRAARPAITYRPGMASIGAGSWARPLRWLAVWAGIAAVALASLFTHLLVWAISSQDCTVGFDTSSVSPPAAGSPQGWLCGEQASPWGLVVWDGGFVLSLIVTVGLVVFAWRRWSWRAGVPALALAVLMPLATSWVLNLPPDDCTARAQAALPTWECVRG